MQPQNGDKDTGWSRENEVRACPQNTGVTELAQKPDPVQRLAWRCQFSMEQQYPRGACFMKFLASCFSLQYQTDRLSNAECQFSPPSHLSF